MRVDFEEGRRDARVAGVVLAAGASSRMDGLKALALIDGESFVGRAARTLAEGGVSEVIVVLGPPHGDRVRAELSRAVTPTTVVLNGEPGRGMLSSLQLGLARAREHGASAAVVALVDHPRVVPGTVAALIAAWRESSARLVRPVYEERRGHPYLVDGTLFGALDAAAHDAGARPILRAVRERVDVAVDDPAIHEDVDTPADANAIGVVVPGSLRNGSDRDGRVRGMIASVSSSPTSERRER